MKKISAEFILFVALLLLGLNLFFQNTIYLDGAPGDLGDGRLNWLFLEHNFQYFFGAAKSYWDPTWNFFPAKNTLALSDNLLGAAPVYIVYRLLGFSAFGSYQAWFISFCILNFAAMWLLLRELGLHPLARLTGSFLFAFAMPRSMQLVHAQLLPNCFTPLALFALARFFKAPAEKAPGWLAVAALMIVWQIWAAVYLGWYILVALYPIFIAALIVPHWRKSILQIIRGNEKKLVLIALVSAGLLLPFLYHYGLSRSAHGGRKLFHQIESLPTFFSYLHAPPWSYWYGDQLKFPVLGHERVMFVGFFALLAPWALIIILLVPKLKKKIFPTPFLQNIAWATSLSFLFLFFATLCLGEDYTLWRFAREIIPGASGFRAFGRVIVILLVPISIAIALLISKLAKSDRRLINMLAVALSLACITENYTSGPKKKFREKRHLKHLQYIEKRIEKKYATPCKAIHVKPVPYHLFFNAIASIDAMWYSLTNNIPTSNGYSGDAPAKWKHYFDYDYPVKNIRAWYQQNGLDLSKEELCIIAKKARR